MNPEAFRIDSPAPAIAAADSARYLEFMRPSLIFGGMEYDAQEFEEDLECGDLLLIRIWEKQELVSVSAVRTRELEDGRDLYIVATAGKGIHSWIIGLDTVLMQLARETGCNTITVQTRQGLTRLAHKRGWKTHQVIIRKKVVQ